MTMMSLALRQSIKSAKKLVVQQSIRPMTILSKESGEEFKKQNYTSRMKDSGRPVSPHVTIYSFPIAALTSITNRVTGCMLSFGAAGLGTAELLGGSGTALSIMQTIGSQGFIVTSTAKFAVAFPLVYHYGAAIRHLTWDSTPDMLTNAGVESSSYQLAGGSVAISALLSIL